MSLFRSEDMHLCKLIVTKDNAFEITEALLALNEVFIVNLNPDEQPQKLTYSKSVSKGNEIISNGDYIISECVKYKVPLNKVRSFRDFMQRKESLQRSLKLSKVTIVDYLAKEVKSKHDFLKEQTVRIENMCQDYNDLVEYFKVVEASQDILAGEAFKEVSKRIENKHSIDLDNIHERKSIDHEEAKHLIASSFISERSSEIIDESEINVGKVVGTGDNKDFLRLSRLIFRATRGNALVLNKNEENTQEFKSHFENKGIFIVIFQEVNELRNKIEKIVNNFSK